MHLTHSFWSKPTFHEQQDYTNSRNKGGWPDIKYLWLSMAYSCLTAKRQHGNISLVTDDKGYEFTASIFNLPYTDIITEFNALAETDHRLWAIAKLSAYKCQTKPFVHIDNDVYLWQRIPSSSKPKFLIAQNKIQIPEGYKDTLTAVFKNFQFIPECIRRRGIPEKLFIISAGIVGGNDVAFFHDYCAIADDFLKQNISYLNKLDIGMFNAILDEYLFTCLVAAQNRDVRFVLNVPVEEGFTSIVQFNLVPFLSRYIHLVGFAKQNAHACEQLMLRFRYEFSNEFKRINNILQELYPTDQDISFADPDRWAQAQKAFSFLYTTDVDSLLCKKVKLPEHVEVWQQATNTEQEETCIKVHGKRGGGKAYRLEEMDETLIHFQSPVTINELLESLKAEGFIYDEQSLAHYRFKLIDFVTEKITIDGVLEFA